MLAKDEINCSFNVAFPVNLVSGFSKKGVLVSVKTNTVVPLLGVVSSQGNSLRTLSVGVLDVDVIELSVLSKVNNGASGLIRSGSTQKARAVGDCDNI